MSSSAPARRKTCAGLGFDVREPGEGEPIIPVEQFAINADDERKPMTEESLAPADAQPVELLLL